MGPRRHVALLPGSSGAGAFWQPVADRLPAAWATTLWDWPGAGAQPSSPAVSSYRDLVELVAAGTEDGSDVVAQSMGGAVALALALDHPEKVRRLVLVATSGGIAMRPHDAEEWRAEYRAAFPQAAAWVTEERPDLTAQIVRLRVPTLLVWGDADPISPVSVGRRLGELLPCSRLRVVPGATHAVGHDRPDEVAALVAEHLLAATPPAREDGA